jgi:hypothetical protein
MLRGHVDLLSATLFAGWAVDTARPDSPVEVGIFVDGSLLARLTCDYPRDDLQGRPGLGDGRHGFRYHPYPPLIGPTPKRVTVRHASSGRILGNGDVVLNAGDTPPPPDLNADLPAAFQHLPAPETPRQTFDLLSLYDRGQGLYTLLRQMDFTGRSARQLRYAALGDLVPAANKVPPVWRADVARDMFNDTLLSRDFQQNILRLFLDAFPEKRRLLLVQIPKCVAGSDLSHHLINRYPSIAEHLRTLHWAEKRLLFEALSDTVRRLHFSDTIFVRGLATLADYLDQGLVRRCDRLFTILCDPVDLAIAQVNDILAQLKSDMATGVLQPEMRQWLPVLELDALPSALSDADLHHLGERALRKPEIMIPNPVCYWLGGGDAAAVLARLAEHEAEVTNTQHYPEWRRWRWGIEVEMHQHESIRFLTRESLTPEDLAYCHEVSKEDVKLYNVVEQYMARSNACAVTDWSAALVKDIAAAA